MKITEMLDFLESEFPLAFQDSFDHSGLQIGDPNRDLTGVILGVDVTEELLTEALDKGANLILTHHPLLFHPLREVSTKSYVERCTTMAIKHDLTLYAMHTNLDNAPKGLNRLWAERAGLRLETLQVIRPLDDYFYKINVFVPYEAAQLIRKALNEVGAGYQGKYSGCSFTVKGEGRFIPNESARPYVGDQGVWHVEPEESISCLLPKHMIGPTLKAVRNVHPYEEPAIDIYPVKYQSPEIGAGIIGELPEPMPIMEFLKGLKQWQTSSPIALSKVLKEKVHKVAYCGGAGAFLLPYAAKMGADLFITGEVKYNHYLEAQDYLTLATMGHYETEWLAMDVLESTLSKKKGNFAVHKALHQLNPIRQYI